MDEDEVRKVLASITLSQLLHHRRDLVRDIEQDFLQDLDNLGFIPTDEQQEEIDRFALSARPVEYQEQREELALIEDPADYIIALRRWRLQMWREDEATNRGKGRTMHPAAERILRRFYPDGIPEVEEMMREEEARIDALQEEEDRRAASDE